MIGKCSVIGLNFCLWAIMLLFRLSSTLSFYLRNARLANLNIATVSCKKSLKLDESSEIFVD